MDPRSVFVDLVLIVGVCSCKWTDGETDSFQGSAANFAASRRFLHETVTVSRSTGRVNWLMHPAARAWEGGVDRRKDLHASKSKCGLLAI